MELVASGRRVPPCASRTRWTRPSRTSEEKTRQEPHGQFGLSDTGSEVRTYGLGQGFRTSFSVRPPRGYASNAIVLQMQDDGDIVYENPANWTSPWCGRSRGDGRRAVDGQSHSRGQEHGVGRQAWRSAGRQPGRARREAGGAERRAVARAAVDGSKAT